MPRSRSVQTALLLGAVLLAFSSQLHPVAAVITVTSNGATPIAPYFQPPRDLWDDDDSDSEEEYSPSHQTWERTWTMASHTALLDDRDEINEVKISIPGRVFLSTASGQASLAKVRFSGNSAEVLDFFEVVSLAQGVLEIRQRPGLTKGTLDGYLLVEVTLAHLQKLKSVTATGSADVIVENNVLIANSPSDSVSIVTRGSGDVFIHNTPAFNIQQLALTIAGSGDIELSTTQIEAKALSSMIHGSGDLRLFVNTVHAKDTVLAVAGSGDVYVNSYNLNSDTLSVEIAGNGDVSVYPTGKCTTAQVAIAGSGNAYLGSIVCVHAHVQIGGSGDAIVQATQALDGGVVGSGDVKYMGQAPAMIAPESSLFSRKKASRPMAKPASYNKYDEAKIHDLPERQPVRLSINFASSEVTDRMVLVPLVLLALLAVWFIRHETKKQNAQERKMRAQELQPLANTQAQVLKQQTTRAHASESITLPFTSTAHRSQLRVCLVMLGPRCVQTALLLSAVLLAFSSQLHPVAAVITVTSNGATPIAPYFQPPRDLWDDDDSDSEEEYSPSHQTWERTWTMASHTALLDDRDEINEVKISIPGRVFLSTASGQASLAKVRFSGNSAEVLDFFEVVSLAQGVLEIRQRPGLTKGTLDGYLLVEVTLAHLQKLKSVTATGSADVIVENNVLIANSPSDSVSIVTRGSGDVFIHNTPAFNIQQLALTIAGSGDIELSTTQIEAKALSSMIHGSGDLRLFANSVQVKETKISVAGSGDTYVNTYNFDSDSVVVSIAGSGDVSLYPSGHCASEQISISGSGDAYLGSIACVQATVKISGSGEAFVQASQSLDGHVAGSGNVKYVGQVPAMIAPKSKYVSRKKTLKPMAKAASYNKYEEVKMSDLPERKPVRMSMDFMSGITDVPMLVPLVIVALLAACFIRHEIKKQNTQERMRMRAQEMQPLVNTQAQVYV